MNDIPPSVAVKNLEYNPSLTPDMQGPYPKERVYF